MKIIEEIANIEKRYGHCNSISSQTRIESG